MRDHFRVIADTSSLYDRGTENYNYVLHQIPERDDVIRSLRLDCFCVRVRSAFGAYVMRNRCSSHSQGLDHVQDDVYKVMNEFRI